MARGEVIAAFALSEPLIVSDKQNVQTSFVKNGNKFIIKGIKKWITFGHIADLFIVIAANNGKSTAFLVERNFSGVKTTPIQGMEELPKIIEQEVVMHEKTFHQPEVKELIIELYGK